MRTVTRTCHRPARRPTGRRTALALLVAGALALASCGDDGEPGADAAGDASATTAQSTVAGSDGDTGTSASQAPAADELPPEGRGVVTANADGTRTVTSTWGTSTVPADPQRIVSVIGDVDFEAMLALGVTPIAAGAQGGAASSGFAPHLGELTDGVEVLGWADGAPAERIAALEPDLIFVPDQETYDLLSPIATVVPRGSWSGPEWKEDFRYVAEVLGLEARADELLAEYDARVADLRERLAPVIDGMTVASPQTSYDHTQVVVAGPDQFSSAVLTELGFALHPVTAAGDGWSTELSFERLGEIGADVLFWQVRQTDDGSPDTDGLAVATGSPLYDQLPAVQAGRVFEVPNRPWYFPSILGAHQILDDVDAALLT